MTYSDWWHLTVNTLPASVKLAVQGQSLFLTLKEYCNDALNTGLLQSMLEPRMGETPRIYFCFPREYLTFRNRRN